MFMLKQIGWTGLILLSTVLLLEGDAQALADRMAQQLTNEVFMPQMLEIMGQLVEQHSQYTKGKTIPVNES